MGMQNHSILAAVIQGGHAETVALLWPHCSVEKEYRSLESAISLGFHDIADSLIETGEFAHLHSRVNDTELPARDQFSERDSAAFQQWERFFFVRRGQPLPLNCVFLNYALLLAAKAERNAGLRLMEILLGETVADPSCKIKIKGDFETPLTAAAERCNLEILTALFDRPDINLKLCGKYNLPAFLHLLASRDSVSTERGHAIARRLVYETPSNRFFIHHGEFNVERAFMNVLRFGDSGLVKQVIDLVRGAAGVLILPLLIRANEADGLKWVLNGHAIPFTDPLPALWVLLCEYFECHEDQDALGLFTRVAEFLVEKGFWSQATLKCLYTRNFSFIQQLFYPRFQLPKEITEKALVGLPAASTDQSLIEEWVKQGHAQSVLWNAIHCGIWKSPAFETLFNSSVDPNVPDPHLLSPGRPEPRQISHAFFADLTSEGQKIPFRPSPALSVGANPPDPARLQ